MASLRALEARITSLQIATGREGSLKLAPPETHARLSMGRNSLRADRAQ